LCYILGREHSDKIVTLRPDVDSRLAGISL
jgi:hypothetical protein